MGQLGIVPTDGLGARKLQLGYRCTVRTKYFAIYGLRYVQDHVIISNIFIVPMPHPVRSNSVHFNVSHPEGIVYFQLGIKEVGDCICVR